MTWMCMEMTTVSTSIIKEYLPQILILGAILSNGIFLMTSRNFGDCYSATEITLAAAVHSISVIKVPTGKM